MSDVDFDVDEEIEVEDTEEDTSGGKMDTTEGFTGEEIRNPIKAIRAKCSECTSNMTSEIRRCNVHDCALYPFRMGSNPYRTRTVTDEQREALVERGRRMAAIRMKRIEEKKKKPRI